MGHTHALDSGTAESRVALLPRLCLTAFVVLVALLTVSGFVFLWPHGDAKVTGANTSYAAPGVTMPRGVVVSQSAPCPVQNASGDVALTGPGSSAAPGDPAAVDGAGVGAPPAPADCGQLRVRLETGSDHGRDVAVYVPPEVLRAGLKPGDRVALMKVPPAPGAPAGGSLEVAGRNSYSFLGIERQTPLWVLAALFIVLVVVVARWRGIRALLGLLIAGAVILKFVLPSLLEGHSAVPVAVVGSIGIMYLVLYLAHGVSMRTSAALAGTIFGVAATAGIGELAVRAAHLTGVGDENAGMLQALVGNVSLQGLLTCGIIIAGLGVLNDVTITQASAVWELRAAGATSGLRDLFTRSMRIGRDHLASTVYTIVFAYVGTAVPVLLLIAMYQQPLADLLLSEDLTAEIVRTLASAIGLVLAIPLTTAVAVAVIGPHAHTPLPVPGSSNTSPARTSDTDHADAVAHG